MKRHLTIAVTVTLILLLSVGQLPVFGRAAEKERSNSERDTPVKFVKPLKQDLGTKPKRPDGESTTLLSDGRSLLLGGEGLKGSLATAEIRDNRTGAITRLAQGMAQNRAWHTATVLPDGKVLIIGGISDKGIVADTVETFDPETSTFTRAPGQIKRAYHTATLLTDGRVLMPGFRTHAQERLHHCRRMALFFSQEEAANRTSRSRVQKFIRPRATRFLGFPRSRWIRKQALRSWRSPRLPTARSELIPTCASRCVFPNRYNRTQSIGK